MSAALARDENCLFCKIIAGEIPSTAVYQNEQVYAFRDINPIAPTHVLIVPRLHIRDITAPEATEGATLGALIAAANAIAQQEGVAQSGFRLTSNVGPDAGQSVFHLHLHLLGGKPLGWSTGE
jgi:histidine triad (HIT) family protein